MTTDVEHGGTCPRCRAPYEPGQEYCLECGRRLPVAGSVTSGVGAAWQRRVGRYPGDWIWPVLVGLLIAVVMTGIAILISRGADVDDRPFFVATTTGGLAAPSIQTLTPTAETTAEIETAPTVTTRPRPRPRPRQLVDWPPSQSGYTVVIASLPAAGGRAAAVRKAREVLRSGLPDVGVIDSGEYSSLHPGYYVVFSGIYGNQRAALRAAPRAQDLYPAAYIRQISR